jgi:hypothetical protein
MRPRRSSSVVIALVLVAEIAAALLIAYSVAQAYVAYECGRDEYRREHPETCEGGLPYPIF